MLVLILWLWTLGCCNYPLVLKLPTVFDSCAMVVQYIVTVSMSFSVLEGWKSKSCQIKWVASPFPPSCVVPKKEGRKKKGKTHEHKDVKKHWLFEKIRQKKGTRVAVWHEDCWFGGTKAPPRTSRLFSFWITNYCCIPPDLDLKLVRFEPTDVFTVAVTHHQ